MVVTAWQNHILPLSFGSCSFWTHWVGEKSSCRQYHIANLRADINHSLKQCVEDEWGEERVPSYLTSPRERAGVISFLPFSSSLTNKSAHVTSLLETLKGLPCARQKTSKLLTMTGKAHPGLVMLLLQPYFAQRFPTHSVVAHSPSLVLWTGSAHPHLCPCQVITCWLHPVPQISVHVTCSERPSLTIPYGNLSVAIFVLLWFHCSSLFHQYISEMIFSAYLLVL